MTQNIEYKSKKLPVELLYDEQKAKQIIEEHKEKLNKWQKDYDKTFRNLIFLSIFVGFLVAICDVLYFFVQEKYIWAVLLSIAAFIICALYILFWHKKAIRNKPMDYVTGASFYKSTRGCQLLDFAFEVASKPYIRVDFRYADSEDNVRHIELMMNKKEKLNGDKIVIDIMSNTITFPYEA